MPDTPQETGQVEAAGRLIADLAALMVAVQEAPEFDGRKGQLVIAFDHIDGEWCWEVEACLHDEKRNFYLTRPQFFEAVRASAEMMLRAQ